MGLPDVYFAADPCRKGAAHPAQSLYRLSGRYRHFAAHEHAVFAPESGPNPDDFAGSATLFRKTLRHAEAAFPFAAAGISPDRRAPPDAAEIRADFREFALGENDLLLLQVGSGFKTKGTRPATRWPACLRRCAHARLIVISQDDPAPFCAAVRSSSTTRAPSCRAATSRASAARRQPADPPGVRECRHRAARGAGRRPARARPPAVCGYAYIEEAEGGRVVASPFVQETLTAVEQMLSDPAARRWQANAALRRDGGHLQQRRACRRPDPRGARVDEAGADPRRAVPFAVAAPAPCRRYCRWRSAHCPFAGRARSA